MFLVVFVQELDEFVFVCVRNRFVKNLEMSLCLRIEFLIDFKLNIGLIHDKMQVHLLIEQQWS